MPVEQQLVSDAELEKLESVLLNKAGDVSLHRRFRALFTLRNLDDDRAVKAISNGFADESALLKHELAYCLGQMKRTSALPILEHVLRDTHEDPMVRHEAAEALGAIAHPTSMPVLQQYISDPDRAVRETCEIALAKVVFDNSPEGKEFRSRERSEFTSIDPAPPSEEKEEIPALRARLLDISLPLFQRYRAMFALRDIGTPTAIDALADGFTDSSDLFKHEIAFVFGQMSDPHSVPALLKVLQKPTEADMVRHEAAEALGGIATDDVLLHLREWNKRPDAPRVVRESCEIALDMYEYERSGDLEYADGGETEKGGEAVTVVV
ncbi:deoxyhypusine hydroxylase [Dacryopinax primogenitus]|uniref:Deoxyhypusine hydroxylase n=1 Tax=Dacryopinax primogenitus (strain DJM 731) TaxID=1858805 RepID=M5FZ66_DACPD|nr:deoxyhypusine hydroxylase [Dacryopinax primogenitus]EJU03336.1 deoxyhypusine hydroxylase [Dacryopinax primogenitus]